MVKLKVEGVSAGRFAGSEKKSQAFFKGDGNFLNCMQGMYSHDVKVKLQGNLNYYNESK